MAPPPKPLSLRAEDMGADVPEWARMMFEQVNAFGAGVSEVLAKGVTRADNLAGTEKLAVIFTTEATAANTFPIKVAHGVPGGKVTHAACSKLERVDGTAVTAAWSMTWANASDGQALVTFQGLSNSAKYRANMTFE